MEDEVIFRFSIDDTKLIEIALRVASQATNRKDMAEKYEELQNIIHNQIQKKGNKSLNSPKVKR